jgi:hypothetical protein
MATFDALGGLAPTPMQASPDVSGAGPDSLYCLHIGLVMIADHLVRLQRPPLHRSTEEGLGRSQIAAVDELDRAPDQRAGAGDWPAGQNLWIVATDYVSGERVVFGRPGSPEAKLAAAVAASCAIPGFYRPVEVGGGVMWTAASTPAPTSTCWPGSSWTSSSA